MSLYGLDVASYYKVALNITFFATGFFFYYFAASVKEEKMDTVIEDDELGSLIVRVNPRARSLVFRTKSDAVYVLYLPAPRRKR